MKKAKLPSRRSRLKRSLTPTTVEEYLAGVPEPARATLKKLRAAIRRAVPAEATEAISYGMPAFTHNRRVLVWYAGFRNHCSLFPTASVIEAFKNELDGLVTSKGTIQFPLDQPLPIRLITRIVRARVARQKEMTRR